LDITAFSKSVSSRNGRRGRKPRRFRLVSPLSRATLQVSCAGEPASRKISGWGDWGFRWL
jgi:hypothetical protein